MVAKLSEQLCILHYMLVIQRATVMLILFFILCFFDHDHEHELLISSGGL